MRAARAIETMPPVRATGLRPANGAAALLDHVVRLERYRHGRCAARLRLSRLMPENRRPHHCRIAFTVLRSTLQGLDVEVYALDDLDLVLLGRTADKRALAAAVDKLRGLFKGDPLFDREGDDPASAFCIWTDVEADYDDFLNEVRAIAAEERERRRAERAQRQDKKGEPTDEPRRPLDLERLARLEKLLASADISNLVRQQPVCAISPDMTPRRVLVECFTSIDDLERILMPDTDMTRHRGLFQYLTLILDDRMLAYLKRRDGRGTERYFSVNLNVASILSPAFLAFDGALPVGVRGTIVLELQQADVFADLRAFAFARDFVRERGYRVCIDGVTRQSLAYADRDELGVDLVKLTWAPELAAVLDGARSHDLRRAADRVGPERIILHRCESADAIRFGHALGITMFQGHHVDELLPLGERAARSALERPR